MVGFTTARPQPISAHVFAQPILDEAQLNLPFRAAGLAAEEAILLSMLHARSDVTLEGKKILSLRDCLQKTEKA